MPLTSYSWYKNSVRSRMWSVSQWLSNSECQNSNQSSLLILVLSLFCYYGYYHCYNFHFKGEKQNRKNKRKRIQLHKLHWVKIFSGKGHLCKTMVYYANSLQNISKTLSSEIHHIFWQSPSGQIPLLFLQPILASSSVLCFPHFDCSFSSLIMFITLWLTYKFIWYEM